MLIAARAAQAYVSGLTFGEFVNSGIVQDAVTRQVQTIGEAASRVTPAFREAHPEIPWGDITGMPNRLVHDYPAHQPRDRLEDRH